MKTHDLYYPESNDEFARIIVNAAYRAPHLTLGELIKTKLRNGILATGIDRKALSAARAERVLEPIGPSSENPQL